MNTLESGQEKSKLFRIPIPSGADAKIVFDPELALTEIRRLREINAELLAACELFMRADATDHPEDYFEAVRKGNAAIKKAKSYPT